MLKLKCKRGPKTELPDSERLRRVQVMLDEMTLKKLSALGGGNVSRGIREAARVAYERYQNS